MQDLFSTSDGLQHLAIINLDNYGDYLYNVACQDNQDTSQIKSTQITFSYQDPNINTSPSAQTQCQNIKQDISDRQCDATQNCICDPDCLNKENNSDPDCAAITLLPPDPSSVNWLMIIILIIIIAVIFLIFKKISHSHNTNENNDEENESLEL